MKRFLTSILTIILALLLSFCCFAETDLDDESTEVIEFELGIYDYAAKKAGIKGASKKGVVLCDTFEIEAGTDTIDAIIEALASAGISYKTNEDGSYIEELNGLGEGRGYAGWAFKYNDDDFSNFGISSITINDGDVLEFHYTANFDTQTDDIGNGWYGLPIITKLKIANQTYKFSKETIYDSNYNQITTYYYGNEELDGNGTEDDPFIIQITVDADTDITALSAEYETSLLKQYRIMSVDLEDENDYTEPFEFSISTLGGIYEAYYVIQVTQLPEDTVVSLRVIGTDKATRNYLTWLKTDYYNFSYLEYGDTVYASDVVKKALSQNKMECEGLDNGYISAVYAPKNIGGYKLNEKFDTDYAGWVFTVNGEYGNYSIIDQVVETGDEIVLHYVKNYSEELYYNESTGSMTAPDPAWLDTPDKKPTAKVVSNSGSSSSYKDDDKTDLDLDVDVDKNEENTLNDTNNTDFETVIPNEDDIKDNIYISDIEQDSIQYTYAAFVIEKGLMSLDNEQKLNPEVLATRGAFAKIISKMSNAALAEPNQNSFTDLIESDENYLEIVWASQRGFINGYGNGTFGANDHITYEQLATMLYRYASSLVEPTDIKISITDLADNESIDAWATEAVLWCVSNNIINPNSDGNICPDKEVSIAELSEIIYLTLNKIPELYVAR